MKLLNIELIKLVRVAALLVALVAAFYPVWYAAIGLSFLGLAAGFMGVEEERRMSYLVMAIALTTVAGALDSLPVIGEMLTAFLTNLSTVINAGAVAVISMMIKDRVME